MYIADLFENDKYPDLTHQFELYGVKGVHKIITNWGSFELNGLSFTGLNPFTNMIKKLGIENWSMTFAYSAISAVSHRMSLASDLGHSNKDCGHLGDNFYSIYWHMLKNFKKESKRKSKLKTVKGGLLRKRFIPVMY